MTSLRSLTSALLAAALLALVGCGGGSDGNAPAAPVQVDSVRTARATLGQAGGTVVATAADGRRYTLTVPPGALAADTEITATPVVSMGSAPLSAGLKGAVRFGPAGLKFALPATLRIEGASTTPIAGTTLVGFVRSGDGASMQLVPPVVVASAIQMDVRHFSDAGVSQATAQEVAQVPVDATASPAGALVDEYLRASTTGSSAAATLIQLHDTRVAPRLALAEFRTISNVRDREQAVDVAQAWFAMIKLSFEGVPPDSALPGGLGPVATALRERVLALITLDFDVGLDACVAPALVVEARVEGLLMALRAEQQVAGFRFLGGLPGLDPDTVARRLNDCARIVFVPRELPTFEAGRPVSLDARAQVVFAADPNASFLAPYAFKVSTNDATIANPTGFSDDAGNYTTVVTPREVDPVFEVEACLVPHSSRVASALCGKQTARGAPASVVLAGEVRFFVTPLGEPRVPLGSARIRLRAELDGSFTVLEAVGSTQRNITSTSSCAPFPADGTPRRDVRLNDSRSATITGGQQNPFLNAGKFIGFTLTGSMVQVADRLQLDCSVITETTTFTNAGQMQILEIERDSQGLPLAIVMGDSSHEGRLVRE